MNKQLSEPKTTPTSSFLTKNLSRRVQERMSKLFKADFSTVRIGVDEGVARLGARALTLGENILFAPGALRPDTFEGTRLLAHELTHVLQQRSGRVRTLPALGPQLVFDPELEREAELFGRWAAEGCMESAGLPLGKGAPCLAIQPALATTPQAVTVGGMIAYYASLHSTWNGAFGNAATPRNYKAPKLQGYRIITAANPGTNAARYIGMGIHESGSGLHVERFNDLGPEGVLYCVEHGITNWNGYRRVYFAMPQGLAQLNKRGEAQHLDDHKIAYERTLGLLQKILVSLQKQRIDLSRVGSAQVVKVLEKEMKALRVPSSILPYAKMGLDMRKWSGKYEELFGRSRARDDRGWHTLTYKYVDTQASNQLDGLPFRYIGATKSPDGDPPAYLEMIKAPSFNLNRTFDQIRT